MRLHRTITFSASFLLLATLAAAQNTPDATEQRFRALEEKIIELEGQIRQLKAQPPAAVPAAPDASAQALSPAATVATESANPPINLGGARNAGKALNPDISVIGDFVGSAGRNNISPVPSLEMHESEIGLQAIIDPYARGDFFVSFGEQGVELEEGFITFTALPKGFVAKVGKMRSAFGKVNTLHNHVLPWIDRPLVTENLVGGEEGIGDAGFSITHGIPAPKGIFLEATGQVFRGDAANVFKATNRSDLSTVARLRGYKDITESTNLELGGSFAQGHNDSDPSGNFLTRMYGVDATLRYKPLRRAIYKSFVARSEFVWSQRQQPATILPGSGQLAPGMQRSFGYFASADYQFARRWYAGVRYDHSDRSNLASLTDQGGSVVLTYWPSEFSQIRGQYRTTSYGRLFPNPTADPTLNGGRTNEFRVQFLFSIGAHGAHAF